MAAEFKVASAYADFHIDGVEDEVKDAVRRLKAKSVDFDRAGKQAGDAYAKGFRSGVKLGDAVDKEKDKLRAKGNQFSQLGQTSGEGYSRGFRTGMNLRPAMVEGVATVKSSRAAFAAEGRQAGQAYAKGFGGQHVAGPSVSSGGGNGEAAGEKIAKDMAEGIRKGSKDVDTELSRTAARANASFDALTFAGLSVGLPAAAAVGVAGVSAALLLGVGAFAAFGIKNALYSQSVSVQWVDTANAVAESVNLMSTQFEGPLVSALQKSKAEFRDLEPTIEAGMTASAGYINELTDAGLNFAHAAIPGMVTAAQGAGPVIKGLGDFALDTGRGLGTMFVTMTDGADGAGRGMSILGGITEDLLTFIGGLTRNLADNSGEMTILQGMLSTVEGAMLNATASGSGLIGMLHGASLAGGGVVTTLSSLLSLVSMLPAQITQFGGSFTVAALAAKKFGIDAGAGFSDFGSKVKAAQAESGKLGGIVTSLAGAAFNPATLAVGALAVGLQILGDRQQKAAQAAEDHRQNVNDLTEAIRQDSGVVGEAATAANVKALNDKNAANNVKAFGQNLATATLAANNNATALKQVNTSSNEYIANISRQAGASPAAIKALQDINNGLLQNGGAFDGVKGKATDAFALLSNGMKTTDDLAATMGGHTVQWTGEQISLIEQIYNGTGAIGEQAKATRDAQQAYYLAEQGATGLTQAQIDLRDATLSAFQATTAAANSQLGYRGSVLNTKQALDDYNTTNKDGKASEDDRARALLGVEQAMMSQIDAAKQQAIATSAGTTEQQRNADGMRAAESEAINLANAFKGPLPDSLKTTIAGMSVTDAKALGLKVSVDNLGHAVVTLPNGKSIQLNADTQAARDAVNGLVRDINGRVATIKVNTELGYTNIPVGYRPAGGRAMMAEGGILEFYAGGGTRNLTPMGQAPRIVPSNTQRVVGDNPHVPEAYIPLQRNSASSQGTLAQANAAMGVTVEVPQAPALPPVTINVYQQPGQDMNALAAAVSRKIELQRKAV